MVAFDDYYEDIWCHSQIRIHKNGPLFDTGIPIGITDNLASRHAKTNGSLIKVNTDKTDKL